MFVLCTKLSVIYKLTNDIISLDKGGAINANSCKHIIQTAL